MDMLQQLRERYTRYQQELDDAKKHAPLFSGYFGLAGDSRSHPCNRSFYEDVGQWVEAFLQAGPEEEAVYEAAKWILTAPAAHRKEPVFDFMYAAHGHCRQLIPLLSPANRAALKDFYDANYPKRERLPVHKEIYKLLRE